MEQLEERIAELLSKHYTCSQIMVKLSQDMNQNDNEQLIQAMFGLSGGMMLKRTCGTLSGGCCMLATYGGIDMETVELIKKFGLWFEENFGYVNCVDIVGYDDKKMANICPGLIKDSFIKCMEILTEAGLDPYTL